MWPIGSRKQTGSHHSAHPPPSHSRTDGDQQTSPNLPSQYQPGASSIHKTAPTMLVPFTEKGKGPVSVGDILSGCYTQTHFYVPYKVRNRIHGSVSSFLYPRRGRIKDEG